MSDHSEVTRLKSPPFPSIPLQKAVDRADQLYRQERDHLAPITSAARAWGMSPTSSGPHQTVGALKQFGLVEDEGSGASRKVRLTKDALRILLDKEPKSVERAAALVRCFLSPKIFNEIWHKWGTNLPSEQTMINHLVLERRLANLAPFSDQGAIELLGNYRSSVAFASPQDIDNGLPMSDPVEEDNQMQTEPATETKTVSMQLVAPSRPQPSRPTEVVVASTERIVFVEEGTPGQHIKLVASGDLDEEMLDALENYIKRQKRRLTRTEALN